MAYPDSGIILNSDLAIDGVAVNDDVKAFAINFTTEAVAVGPTASRRQTIYKAGKQEVNVEITYFQSEDTSNLTGILYTAMTDGGDGIVTISGKPANDHGPFLYSVDVVVTGWMLGGEVWTAGEASVTLPAAGPLTRQAASS